MHKKILILMLLLSFFKTFAGTTILKNINIKSINSTRIETRINCEIEVSFSTHRYFVTFDKFYINQAREANKVWFAGDVTKRFYFFNNDGTASVTFDNIGVKVVGTIVIPNKLIEKNKNIIFSIGCVGNPFREYENLEINLNLDDILPKPKPKVSLEIIKNLELGRIYAGGTLSTSTTGNPAIIKVTKTENLNYYIRIPETVDIRNNKNDRLRVNLRLEPQQSNSDTTNMYILHGNAKTNRNNNGKYEGEVILRVIF